MDVSVLRASLFDHVPPFINFVPAAEAVGGSAGHASRGPQYWDQPAWDVEHFWRIPVALARWITQWAEAEARDKLAKINNTYQVNDNEGECDKKV